MAPTLYRGHRPGAQDRARDWAEIQERMLVPLYETVYDRLEVGADTRMLALGCGSGLAMLLAGARGAAVTGCDTDESLLDLARQRLMPEPTWGIGPAGLARTRLLTGTADVLEDHIRFGDYDLITAFDPAAPASRLRPALAAVARSAPRGSAVVLAGWGPPERCATSRLLAVATRLAEPRAAATRAPRLSGRDDLEDLARHAGLRPDGSGRVSCPFGYADAPSAVRGLLSTGLFDAAVEATDQQQVEKEITEALHPYRRPDGTVRMDNVFRYMIARA
ncbi:class I SAM-dependent methyltransferase [Actinacidiphila acididurans]|uniref:Class I SAM-dependent methyltransferase n=1 Tax=Actinacidiphila acididurans TaxID=2784346 RepID=A0ABS2TKQ5_9ACTN|nr:class I SAM-dependent methyltransferase [Actinacidiphila acididurans]MBM9503914.1 class I SAM-dependent methyltransferase [Actinacidiphila acididurans]